MADQVEKGDQGKPSPYKRINDLFDGDPEDSSNAGTKNAPTTFEVPAVAIGPYPSPARTARYEAIAPVAPMPPGHSIGGLFQVWQCSVIANSLPDGEPDFVHLVKLEKIKLG